MLKVSCKGPLAFYQARDQNASQTVEQLRVQRDAYKTDAAALQAEVAELQEQLNTAHAQLRHARSKCEQLESELGKSRAAADSAECQHNTELEQALAEFQQQSNELLRLRDDNAKLRLCALSTASIKETSHQKLLDAMSKLDMTDAEARHIVQELEAARLRAQQAESDLAASQEAAEQLGKQHAGRMEQCQALLADNQRLLEAHGGLQRQHRELQEAHEQLQVEMQRQRRSMQRQADTRAARDSADRLQARPPWVSKVAAPTSGRSPERTTTPAPDALSSSRVQKGPTPHGVAALQEALRRDSRRHGISRPVAQKLTDMDATV